MKKIYMTMVAMLCGATAFAQTCTISVEDIQATAGEPAYLEFLINQDGTAVNGCGTVIELPQGITVNEYYDEDDEAMKKDVEYPAAKSAFTTMLEQSPDNPQRYTLAVASTGSTFKTSTNVMAKIGIIADKSMKNGDYEVTVGPTSFNLGTESVYPQDVFTVKVTVTGGTGINSINAADSKAPVYNMAGQRVSKTQKGVYIQNGKKVAVK